MSKTVIGIGVVVAGIAASVAVGGYVLREPVPSVQTVPARLAQINIPPAELQRSVVPTPDPAPSRVSTVARAIQATPTPDAVPAVSAPRTEVVPSPAVQPDASGPVPAPVIEPPKVDPPKYVPDPTPVTPPAPAPEPEPQFEELTVERHSVIGIRLDYAVSTRTAKVEDRISATVSRNVTVHERVAIPEGARLEGVVTVVDRGGKFRDRPRLGLQFDTMILTDGTRMSIRTDAIIREGDSPSADAAAKVGAGSAVGAILGGMLGGKKGAIIGGAAGAAGGAATVVQGDGNETALQSGAPLTVRLTDDLTVLVRRQ